MTSDEKTNLDVALSILAIGEIVDDNPYVLTYSKNKDYEKRLNDILINFGFIKNRAKSFILPDELKIPNDINIYKAIVNSDEVIRLIKRGIAQVAEKFKLVAAATMFTEDSVRVEVEDIGINIENADVLEKAIEKFKGKIV